MFCNVIVEWKEKINLYPTRLSKHLWEWYNIKNHDFGYKFECSLFNQKWLTLGPSGQILFWFKKYKSSLSQIGHMSLKS